CGHQKLFPPHLSRAQARPRRKQVIHVSRASAASRGAAAVRAIDQPVALAVGLDLLLDALTYARAGRWPLFDRLAQQIGDEPWFALESARLLSALGHIDLVVDL